MVEYVAMCDGYEGGGGGTVLGWIRVSIPITHKEIERGVIKGLLRQDVKKLRRAVREAGA